MTPLNFVRSRFPEELYPVERTRETEYNERLLYGLEKARQSTVIIGGLVRDNGKILPATLARLEYLSSFFFDSTFVLYENDSVDETRSILKAWKPASPCYYYSYNLKAPKFGSIKSKERVEAMSRYRTSLQKHIALINETDNSDYVIILDMDIEGGFSYEGIMNSLSYNYDAVASNSLYYENNTRHYYDSYALKTIGNIDFPILHRGGHPLKVHSAFGGLAVYKMNAFLGGVYGSPNSEEWCEHVGFHENMKCWLNPSQITLYNRTRYSI